MHSFIALVLIVGTTMASTASAQCVSDSEQGLRQLQMRSFAQAVVTAERRHKVRAGMWVALPELIRSQEWLDAVALVPPGRAASLVTATSGTLDGFVMPQIRGKFVVSGSSYLLLLEDSADPCGSLVVASDDGRIVEGMRRPER